MNVKNPTQMDETIEQKNLVGKARKGDRSAFDQLVRRNFGRVYGFLFRMIGNHEDAEDLAQECFVRAYFSLRWFKGNASFSTWVYRIGINLCRDYFRSRKRRPSMIPLTSMESLSFSSQLSPADKLVHSEFSKKLTEAMQKLPYRIRAVFVLRVLEGMDYSEVARLVGCTEGTARVYVLKARRLLFQWMKPWLKNNE